MLIAAATVLPARVGFVLLIAAFLAVLVLAPLTAVGLATLGVQGVALETWQTRAYAVLAAVIFLGIAVHVVFREREPWKQVLLATVPAVLLPFVSVDYTLIYLHFPLVFFVNAPRVSRWDTVYVVLFAVLLVPIDCRYLSYELGGVSISVAVYPAVLLSLAALAILERKDSTIQDEVASLGDG